MVKVLAVIFHTAKGIDNSIVPIDDDATSVCAFTPEVTFPVAASVCAFTTAAIEDEAVWISDCNAGGLTTTNDSSCRTSVPPALEPQEMLDDHTPKTDAGVNV